MPAGKLPAAQNFYMIQNPYSPQKQSIKKKERLKSRDTILTLFTLNQQIKLYPFKLVWLSDAETQAPELKIGVSVAKRQHKTAVARNRIKRLMREALRKNKSLVCSKIHERNLKVAFMLIYIGNNVIPHYEMEHKIKHVLIRLADKIENH